MLTSSVSSYSQAIAKDGFSCIDRVLTESQVFELGEAIRSTINSNKLKNYGIRRLLEIIPSIGQLCWQPEIRNLVEPILGSAAFPIRGIFFDKNSEANWGVSWHQDLTIAVRQRIDTPDFSCWSVKDGVDCVQPPVFILEKMLTLRIHLDDTNTENGCLYVIPNSHRQGRLQLEKIDSLKDFAIPCSIGRGGVLVMKPLLVHASKRSIIPAPRRIIHIEFAAQQLPNGLQWYCS
jgi:hypothetical protein